MPQGALRVGGALGKPVVAKRQKPRSGGRKSGKPARAKTSKKQRRLTARINARVEALVANKMAASTGQPLTLVKPGEAMGTGKQPAAQKGAAKEVGAGSRVIWSVPRVKFDAKKCQGRH
eukprot:ctg_129.g100